jgi:NAD-dependent dihydropyrimidine dehydrogenase PreA subunit
VTNASEASEAPAERTPNTQEYTATTIPVHVDLGSRETVIHLGEAEKILREATAIALGPCICRVTEKNCDAPIDTCLALNSASAEMVEKQPGFRYVDVETALAALETSHKAGLVHLAFRKPGAEITEFCSCCTCCCWFFKELKSFRYSDGIVASSHVARHDVEQCVGCGVCVERCPFGAWELEKGVPTPTFDPERCFGCGVCVSTCPAGAITLVPRDHGANTSCASSGERRLSREPEAASMSDPDSC